MLSQHGPMGGGAPFPPLAQTWGRLRQWLANDYPELGDTLNWGILPADLQQVELALGFALPPAIRDSYLVTDGQEAESAAGCAEGLFFGLTLLPLEDVLEEWRFWREVDNDPSTGANAKLKERMDSVPPNWVLKEYSSRGWIPLIADKAGNYLGVDLSPGEGGQAGQVIVFGRDFDTKVVMFRGQGLHGWAQWLAGFVDDLEAGEGFELGTSNEASDGSEDSVGYESYFFDGVSKGLGDGGGDTGTGGMRLSGEYRGWNVLEAWADKSLRKWREVGMVSVPTASSSKGKVCIRAIAYKVFNAHSLVQEIEQFTNETVKALSNVTSAAEVPIPVLTDLSEPSTSQPFANVTNRDSTSHRQSLPTIAVTKPPAPQPVDLPTADDIETGEEVSSPPRNHFDIEAGGDMIMREIPSPTSITSTVRPGGPQSPSASSTFTVRHAATESIPAPIPPPPMSPKVIISSPVITVATPPVQDLLVDHPPAFAAVPLATVAPTSSTRSEDSPVLISREDAPRTTSLDSDHPGGSSISSNDGVLVSEPEELEDDDVSDTSEKNAEHAKMESVSLVSGKMEELGIKSESKTGSESA